MNWLLRLVDRWMYRQEVRRWTSTPRPMPGVKALADDDPPPPAWTLDGNGNANEPSELDSGSRSNVYPFW